MNSAFAGLHILWGSFQHEHFGVQGQIHEWRGHPGLAGVTPPTMTILPGPAGAPTAG